MIPRRRPARVRWLAVAASLTVALLGPAGAAYGATPVTPPPTTAPPTTTPTAPSTPPPIAGVAPGVATGPAGLALLSQSPFVESGQSFHLGLSVTAPTPDTRLEVLGYPRLTTRTDFDTSLKGKLRPSSDYMLGPQPVSSLVVDPAGGVGITIPVNPTSGTGTVRPFTTGSDSGVYPIQIRLLDHAGNSVGTPLTTFLVYVSATANTALQSPQTGAAGLPRLDVALTVPVHEAPSVARDGQLARLDQQSSSALAALARVLGAHPAVPLTLGATPQTLDTLATGTSTDRATLAALAALATGGVDQVAGATYTSVSLPGLIGSGLGSEVTSQINAGMATLAADLRQAPAPGVWTVNGPLDQTTLESVTSAGARQLVVPAPDLSPPPSAYAQTTLAAPTGLATKAGSPLQVVAADPGLSSHFNNGGDTVLAANQLLAELAMIQLETPGETRGVAVVPPAAWQESAPFLDVVLGGLTANPLLAPVTTSALFSAVPAASRGSTPLVRTLTATRPSVPPFADAGLIRAARAAVDAVGSIFPGDRSRVAMLGRQVLASEADDLSSGQRNLVAGVATSALASLRHNITLPGASSVTLTARDGGVPITVFSNGGTGAQIRLRLNSDKLSFRPFNTPGGRCTAPATGVEVCELTLASEATTLKVPVVARTSGVFSLAVTLSSPDGAVRLSDTRATVRSTAFSGVGVILIVVAALALAYWWVRNIRHGRRARDLIPVELDGQQVMEEGVPDTGDEVEAEAPVSPAPAVPRAPAGSRAPPVARAPAEAAEMAEPSPPSWLDEDPVIAEFFSSPAPVYPPPAPDPPRRR